MSALALKAAELLSTDEIKSTVGVGTSGSKFARRINPDAPVLPIRTAHFCRDRALRVLETEEFSVDSAPTLVDDIAVSGLTLACANESVRPRAASAVVGMLFRSKTTRRRIGIDDLRPAVTYSRAGGNNPPINSVSTLQCEPERLCALSERYFGDQASRFIRLIREESA